MWSEFSSVSTLNLVKIFSTIQRDIEFFLGLLLWCALYGCYNKPTIGYINPTFKNLNNNAWIIIVLCKYLKFRIK